MKKKITAFAAIVLCMAILVPSTLAYFTADDTATNVITTSKIDIDLVETAKDPVSGDEVPFENLTGVMPGRKISKIVRVSNTLDAREAWVRVCVSKSIVLEDDTEGLRDVVQIPFNSTEWVAATDSNGVTWHYYKQPLKAEEKTTPLFEQVIFDENAGNEYQNAEIHVNVYAQAVQAKHNGATALDARGWSEYIAEE